MDFQALAVLILQRIDIGWTFMLLVARYAGMMLLLPGIGGGIAGLPIRFPMVLLLAAIGLATSPIAAVPSDTVWLAVMVASEVLFGMALGAIPFMVVTCGQMAGYISSMSMGLMGSQLFDPTAGGPLPDLARIIGDTAVIAFLLMDGHHVVIQALAGLNAQIMPGTFVPTELSARLLTDRFANILSVGLTLALPVVVALLLTQFVMALVSRAVPTVNIFIVSFPLTIGIGLLITIVALPEILEILGRQVTGIENSVLVLQEQAQLLGEPRQSLP